MKKAPTELIATIITKEIPNTVVIYIFGSFNTPYENSESDIDIAILAKDKIPALLRWELSQKLAIVFNRDVDIIDLQQASTVFKFQVVHEGNRLFCKSTRDCDFFENKVASEYLHWNEDRQELLKNIQQKGKIHYG